MPLLSRRNNFGFTNDLKYDTVLLTNNTSIDVAVSISVDNRECAKRLLMLIFVVCA
jgi:hypothetical protein